MNRMTLAFALIASAAAAPAFAGQALTGTTVSTMGDEAIVSLHPSERGIGNAGLIEATIGDAVQLPAERVLLEREKAQVDGAYVTGYAFPSNASAVTPYGAR